MLSNKSHLSAVSGSFVTIGNSIKMSGRGEKKGYLKLLIYQISVLADDTFIKGNGSRDFFRTKEFHREVPHFLCFSCLLLGAFFAQVNSGQKMLN